MKRLPLFIGSLLLLALVTNTARAAENNYAVIKFAKVMDEYWKTKQALANLKDRVNTLEEERKNMVDDLKKAEEDYKRLEGLANNKAVSSEERERRKADAATKNREVKEIIEALRQFERSSNVQIMESRRNLQVKLIGEIRESLNSLARSKGYAAVFDVTTPTPAPGASLTPIVLFAEGLPDLTNDLIKRLNETAPASLVPGPTPSGPIGPAPTLPLPGK